MKRLLVYFFSFLPVATLVAQEPAYDNVFFVNSRMQNHYFFSKTEAAGLSSVKSINRQLPVIENIFHTPGNSLLLQYHNDPKGQWQATIYRQQFRGQDHFKKTSYLSFWVYNSAASTAAEDLPSVQWMKKDSSLSAKFFFKMTKVKAWEQIIVPVHFTSKEIAGRQNDINGIVFSQNGTRGGTHTLYIDDMELLPFSSVEPILQKPILLKAKGYAKHIDIEWAPLTGEAIRYVKIYRSENNKEYKPVGIQSTFIHRYADFTGVTGKEYSYKISFLNSQYEETGLSEPMKSQTKSMTDDELMTMVQEACFRYYWEGAEQESGLAKENIPGRHNMIASGASGFGMMALLVGTERGFITRKESVDRFTRIVHFLEKADSYHGVFSHFIDGPTGKTEPFFGRNDNGGDLVETSFLLQGLLAARAYFNGNDSTEKTIREKITGIWERTEWDWYRRYPDSKFLYWHWSPDKEWIINHRLIGWNETMVTYLLAIASPTHAVPAALYYSGWANQDSTGQQYRKNWGGTADGSMYTNGKKYYNIKLDVGVSNGGPLFFTHYSYLGYDPHKINDKYTNYFINNQKIARINYLYCVSNPGKYKGYGPDGWGLTASDGPYDYSADEPVLRQDRGKLAPTGAISSFPYTPVESMKALKNYYNNYGKFLWGEFGFRDAFNLSLNWCSDIYMGLNQAPMVVMIENYRSALVWNLLMSDKDIQSGLKKLAAEK